MKIAVRGGHTPKSSGASAILNELKEDRKVKDALIKYLKQLGHTVLDVTPSDSVGYPAELNYGIDRANSWGADLFISVHFNKCYKEYNGALGAEVCVLSKFSTAQRVVDGLAYLGFKNRGQKVRDDLGELSRTKMKAMIVEVCFVEATKDVSIYNGLGADKIGKNIAESVSNKKVPTPPKPSNDTKFRVVVGWFSDRDNALVQQKGLEIAGFDSFLVAHTHNNEAGFRVVAGTYSSRDNANAQVNKLKEKGFSSFLVAI